MNGLIVFEKYSFFEKVKFILGIIKKEEKKYNDRKIYIYKIPSINKKTFKRLIKKLKNDNIKNLAVENSFDREYLKLMENEFEIITKEKIFSKNLDKLLIKAANSMGIKKGTLSIGIKTDEKDIDFISILRESKNMLKCIFLYTKNVRDSEEKAEAFYKLSGVPIVVKEKMGENQCDILVFKSGDIVKPADSVRFIINLTQTPLNDSRCAEDIKVFTPEKLKVHNINNCIINELFELTFNVKGFVKKMLDTSS